jgi:hypothetical protein
MTKEIINAMLTLKTHMKEYNQWCNMPLLLSNSQKMNSSSQKITMDRVHVSWLDFVDQYHLATGHWDQFMITIWDVQTLKEVRSFDIFREYVPPTLLKPMGASYIVARVTKELYRRGNAVHVYNWHTGQLAREIDELDCGDVLPFGDRYLFILDNQDRLLLYNIVTGDIVLSRPASFCHGRMGFIDEERIGIAGMKEERHAYVYIFNMTSMSFEGEEFVVKCPYGISGIIPVSHGRMVYQYSGSIQCKATGKSFDATDEFGGHTQHEENCDLLYLGGEYFAKLHGNFIFAWNYVDGSIDVIGEHFIEKIAYHHNGLLACAQGYQVILLQLTKPYVSKFFQSLYSCVSYHDVDIISPFY